MRACVLCLCVCAGIYAHVVSSLSQSLARPGARGRAGKGLRRRVRMTVPGSPSGPALGRAQHLRPHFSSFHLTLHQELVLKMMGLLAYTPLTTGSSLHLSSLGTQPIPPWDRKETDFSLAELEFVPGTHAPPPGVCALGSGGGVLEDSGSPASAHRGEEGSLLDGSISADRALGTADQP